MDTLYDLTTGSGTVPVWACLSVSVGRLCIDGASVTSSIIIHSYLLDEVTVSDLRFIAFCSCLLTADSDPRLPCTRQGIMPSPVHLGDWGCCFLLTSLKTQLLSFLTLPLIPHFRGFERTGRTKSLHPNCCAIPSGGSQHFTLTLQYSQGHNANG